MYTPTQNYGLAKPNYSDDADIMVLNQYVTDKVDELLFQNRAISAPSFSQDESYPEGSLVIYENQLYKLTANKSAGNWDSSIAVLTNLATEVVEGASVEANPSGDATDVLNKLKVDTTIYAVEGSTPTKTVEGNPVEFSDGADAPLVKCVSEITGSQDLHGYDKPWVGGAGKNKIPVLLSEVKSNNTSGTWSGDTYSYSGVTFKVESNSEGYVTKITVNASPSSSAFSFYLKRATTSFTSDTILNGCPSGGGDSTYDLRVSGGYRDIGSGVTIPANSSFSDFWIVIRSGITVSNLVFQPMIRLATETDPTFEPYSNICPITAYTEGEIEVRGKNLVEETYYNGNINSSGVIVANIRDYDLQIGKVKEGATYTITTNELFVGAFYYTKPTADSVSYNGSRLVDMPKTFTAPITGYVAFRTAHNYATPQLEEGETATTYEPYTSTTHTAQFGEDIYSGEVDFVGRSENHDIIKITLDASSNIVRSGDQAFYVFPSDSAKAEGRILSDKFLSGEIIGVDCVFLNSSGAIRFNTTNKYASANDFKTQFCPIEIAYELATPTTSSVTPTNLPIKSLSGYTHIESTTGDMEVEYITEEFQPIVVSDMTGATASADGEHGLVPAPKAGDENKYLKGDGTWGEVSGGADYSSTPKVVGTYNDGTDIYDVYEVTMVTSHSNPNGAAFSYFPDDYSAILSVEGTYSGIVGSTRYYAPMGGWFKQSNDNINITCSVYLVNYGTGNARVYYAFASESVVAGGCSCDKQTIIVRYIKTAQTRSLNLSKGETSGEKKKADETPIEEEKTAENDLDEWIEESEEIEEEVDEGTDEDSEEQEEE